MIKLKQYLKIDGVRHCPGEKLTLSVDQENRFVNQGIAEITIDTNVSIVNEPKEIENENESNLEVDESNENALEDLSISSETEDFLNFDEDEYTASVPENKKKK